ncbi:MAG: hypothetical protein IJZ75_06015 [Clostridia bacterium]|nr:hypothetical protein [Clostridia bacterium]
MKRVVSFLLCFVICFYFVGCKSVQKQNEEAREALMEVFNKERSFLIKNEYTGKTTEESLEKYRFPTEYSAVNAFVPDGYTFVDFDGDGIEEMMIISAELKFFLVLRYEETAIRGYIIERISIQTVKTDGTFSFWQYTDMDYNTVCKVSFDGEDHNISYLALINGEKDEYLLNDKPEQREKIEEYISDWEKNTTRSEWTFDR